MTGLQKIYSCTTGIKCFDEIYTSGLHNILGDLRQENEATPASVQTQNEAKTDLKNSSGDELLLKLTTIARIFTLSGIENACARVHDICQELIIRHNILTNVIGCFKSCDQYVVYSAFKAAVAIVTNTQDYHSEIKAQMRELFLDIDISPWKALYSAKLLCQILHCCHDSKLYLKTMTQRHCCCNRNTEAERRSDSLKKHYVEIAMSCLQQDWNSLLPVFVPYWCYFHECYSKGASGSISQSNSSELIHFQKFIAADIHNNLLLQEKALDTDIELKFATFIEVLMSIVEFEEYCCAEKNEARIVGNEWYEGYHGNKINQATNFLSALSKVALIGKDLPINQEIFSIISHYLHLKCISSDIWVKILDLVMMVLNVDTTTVMNPALLQCALSSLSVLECCALDGLPVATFEGFGGSKILGSKKSKELCQQSSIVLRKISLLMVKAMTVVIYKGQMKDVWLPQTLQYLSLWLMKVSAVHEREPFCNSAAKMLVHLFAEQDDEMVEIMLLLLNLYKSLRSDLDAQASTIIQTIHPHLIFLAFLDSVHFDHSVLLDFLISTETLFLDYLVSYLHFVLEDWTSFCALSETYSTRSSEDQATKRDSRNSVPEAHHVLLAKKRSLDCFMSHNRDRKSSEHLKDSNVLLAEPSTTQVMEGSHGQKEVQAISNDLGATDDKESVTESNTMLSIGLSKGLAGIMLAYSESDDDDVEDECNDSGDDDDACDDGREGIVDDGGDDIFDDDGCKDNGDDDDDVPDEYNDNGHAVAGVACCSDDVVFIVEEEDDDDDDCVHYAGNKAFINDYQITDNCICDHTHNSKCISHDSGPSGSSSLIDKMMTTLIRLRLAAERLDASGLFPYRPGPLLRLMERTEYLYDSC